MTKDRFGKEFLTEYGDPKDALGNEILRTTVGSGLHGIALEGTDDNDEMGIFIQPASKILGLPDDDRPDYTARTVREGERSGPGETDLVIYSLLKYNRLAVKGNPTVLLPLFAPEKDILVMNVWGEELRSIRDAFLSRHAVLRFLKYSEAQHGRMVADKRHRSMPYRPELIEKYGFDTKYASHALRLVYQGMEIATTGRLTLPLDDGFRNEVLAVKQGEYTLEQVSDKVTNYIKLLHKLIDTNSLAVPDEPDKARIEDFSERAHRSWWGWD